MLLTQTMLLAFLAGAGSMALVYTLSMYSGLRQQWRDRRIWNRGQVAPAVIISFEPTGRRRRNCPEIRLQVQVAPQGGRRFIAELFEVLSFFDISTLHTGSQVQVKYDPRHHTDVVLAGPFPIAATAPAPLLHRS